MEAADVAGNAGGEGVALAGANVVIVDRHVEGFGNERALQRDIFGAAAAEGFIDGPTDAAVIHDAIVAVTQARAIQRDAFIADAHAEVAKNDIVRAVGGGGPAFEEDAVAGGGLAGDGAIGVGDDELGFEVDGAADAEDDGARAFGFDAFAQTAGAGVVEVGDFVEFSAAASDGVAAVAFGFGEGQMGDAEAEGVAFDGGGIVGIDFIDAPVVVEPGIVGLGGVFVGLLVAFEFGGGVGGARDGVVAGAEIDIVGDGGGTGAPGEGGIFGGVLVAGCWEGFGHLFGGIDAIEEQAVEDNNVGGFFGFEGDEDVFAGGGGEFDEGGGAVVIAEDAARG